MFFLLCDLLEFLLLILFSILSWRSINIELWVSHWGLQVKIVGFISANMTFPWCTWTSWTCALQSPKLSVVSVKQQGTKNVIFYWGTRDLLDSIRPWSICSHFLPRAMSEFQHFKGKGNYSEGGETKFEELFHWPKTQLLLNGNSRVSCEPYNEIRVKLWLMAGWKFELYLG